MSILAALGIAGAAGIINNLMARDNASVSYKRQQKLMKMQNAMNMANARSMPTVQAEGLRMAGFNPAMLNGAGTQAAPTVSGGNADMPQTVPFDVSSLANLALMNSQKDNIDANTAKVNEEKRGVQQANDIVDAANDAAVQGYLADWNREQEDLEKTKATLQSGTERYNQVEGRIKELEKMKAKVTDPSYAGALGIARGTEAARNETRDRARRLHEYLTGHLDNAVAQKKLGNGTVDALADMDKYTRDKLAKDIDHVSQLIAESESKEELNDEQVEMLQTQISQIGDTILRARLSDENFLRTMAKEAETEEERKAWQGRLDNLTDTEFRKLKYDVGAGIVKGVATGGALGGVGSLANKVLNGKNSSTMNSGKLSVDERFDRDLQNHDFRREWNGRPGVRFVDHSNGDGVQSFDHNRH